MGARLEALKAALLPSPRELTKFSTISDHALDVAAVKRCARVQQLGELSRANTTIVAVADIENHRRLAALVRQDLQRGTRLWLIETDSDLPERLAAVAHRFSTSVIGIHPPDMVRHLIETDPVVRRSLADIDTVRVPSDIIDSLEELGISTKRSSALSRMVRNPKTLVYAIVFVYSALRALPVALIKEFHGSIALLWSIDLVTAIPYTWGVLAMVTGTHRRIRALGTLTTVVTFLAPYIYFWMNGSSYPRYVPIVIGALVAISLSVEFVKFFQERALVGRYAAGAPEVELARV